MKKNKNIKIIKNLYKENMTDEQKQRYRESEKQYRKNMTDEKKTKTKILSKIIQKKHNR